MTREIKTFSLVVWLSLTHFSSQVRTGANLVSQPSHLFNGPVSSALHSENSTVSVCYHSTNFFRTGLFLYSVKLATRNLRSSKRNCFTLAF